MRAARPALRRAIAWSEVMASRRSGRVICAAMSGALAACSLMEAGVLDGASSGLGADASAEGGVDAAMDAPPGVDAGDAITSDGAADADAFVCDRPEGGAPCDPGTIDCDEPDGAVTCEAPRLMCCYTGGVSRWGCIAQDAAASCFNQKRRCDEAADCAPGERCWGTLVSSSATTICAATQPTGNYFQVCKSNTECRQKNCIVEFCAFGGFVESCGGTGDSTCH